MDFSQLIQKKNGIEAYALAHLLSENVPAYTKITKKLCGELLHSPTKGKKALEVLRYYRVVGDLTDKLYQPDMTVPDMEDTNDKWNETASTICKLLPGNYSSTNSLLRSLGNNLTTYANKKSIELNEFIPIFIKEIQKDEFWKKQLTSENFVRKSEYLFHKFGDKIQKKITGGMDSITHIF